MVGALEDLVKGVDHGPWSLLQAVVAPMEGYPLRPKHPYPPLVVVPFADCGGPSVKGVHPVEIFFF